MNTSINGWVYQIKHPGYIKKLLTCDTVDLQQFTDMRIIYSILLLCLSGADVRAQQPDSIFVHLYTDSLKKGTHNYINIDGLFPNGRYLPLDTTHLVFSSSAGQFFGNNLYIDKNFIEDKVSIRVALKGSAIVKEFDMYVKKAPDPAHLPTAEDILRQPPSRKQKRSRN